MAREWYVNNESGSDANDGSAAHPTEHIGATIQMASAGDFVRVVATATPYDIFLEPAADRTISFVGSSWELPGLVIEGIPHNGDWPILRDDDAKAPAGYGSAALIVDKDARFIWIRGFKFTSLTPLERGDPDPLYPNDPNRGIAVHPSAWEVRLEYLYFSPQWLGCTPIEVVRLPGSELVEGHALELEVRCCSFWHDETWAPFSDIDMGAFSEDRVPAKILNVHDCVFYSGIPRQECDVSEPFWCPDRFHITAGNPDHVGSGHELYVNRCTFVNNTTHCVNVNGQDGPVVIRDNVLKATWNNGGGGYEWGAIRIVDYDPLQSSIDHNDFYDNEDRDVATWVFPAWTINDPAIMAQNLVVDPAFAGGGMYEWLYGIFIASWLLPSAAGVLTGAADGKCIGAVRPPGEGPDCWEIFGPGVPECSVDTNFIDTEGPPVPEQNYWTVTLSNIGTGVLTGNPYWLHARLYKILNDGHGIPGCSAYGLVDAAGDLLSEGSWGFALGPGESKLYRIVLLRGSSEVSRFEIECCRLVFIPETSCYVDLCERWIPGSEMPDCGYQKFYDEYPDDWKGELARASGCTHVVIVCYYGPGGPVQLTCIVKEMRPLVSEMSVDLKEYQVQDTDIVFVDPTQYLDPWHEGSLLYGKEWKGAPVEVGSWLVGTEKVLAQAWLYLDDVKHDGELATWTLHDKFNEMLKRHMRANMVRLEDIDCPDNAKLKRVDVNSALCPIGDWTLTFSGSDDYEVYSEQLGFEGKGKISTDFHSASGAIAILATADYWNISAGNPAAGDTITFTTSLSLPRQAAVSALRTALTTYYDLDDDDDLDGVNFDEVLANTNLWRITVIQKDPITALEFARRIMKHIAGAIYVATDGRLTIWQYTPSAKPPDVYATCYSDDLKTAKTGTTQTCDVIVVHYGADEAGELQYAVRLPSAVVFGDVPAVSYAEYENRVVEEIDLEYFTYDDKSQAEWICYYLYSLRCLGHRTFELTNKLLRLNAKPGDVVWVDSKRPEAVGCSVFYRVAKDLSARNMEIGAVDSAGWLAECRTGICGWAYACDPAQATGHWSFCDDPCYKVF